MLNITQNYNSQQQAFHKKSTNVIFQPENFNLQKDNGNMTSILFCNLVLLFCFRSTSLPSQRSFSVAKKLAAAAGHPDNDYSLQRTNKVTEPHQRAYKEIKFKQFQLKDGESSPDERFSNFLSEDAGGPAH